MYKNRDIMFEKGKVLVCLTLTCKDDMDYINTLKQIKKKSFDILELRLDYYQFFLNKQRVITLLSYIRKKNLKPILLTFRSLNEGGLHHIDDNDYKDIYLEVMSYHLCDMIDLEIKKDKIMNYELIDYAHQQGIKVLMSYHNMESMDKMSVLKDYAEQMEVLGADVIKLVCNPRCKKDVTDMICLCMQLSSTLSCYVVCISLSKLGKVTRIIGAMIDSCMTYVTLNQSNSLGQINIDDIYKYLEVSHD